MRPPPEQVAGGPHGRRRDVGLREPAATQQPSDVLGVDRIVFRLAAVDGFHRASVAKDKRHAFASAEVGQPVPGEQAFDTDDQILTIGRNGLEKHLWTGFHMAMPQNLAVLAEDTQVQATRMQINTAIRFVLFRGESHEVSSSSWLLFPLPAYHWGMLRRGPQ
jgi:hypothetical protein